MVVLCMTTRPEDWISKADRPPTRADADAQGCVLAWHIYNGVVICHVENDAIMRGDHITHWRPMPQGPRKAGSR